MSLITSKDISTWVEKALEDQNFNDYKITITGKTEKGDGYLGEVVFANVNGTTKENGKSELNLVIKHGKKNNALRKAVPVRNVFENEIHIYEEVFPALKKFQREKNVRNGFESVARCYKTLTFDNMEVLILDNMRSLGYELHDRKKSLNLHHIKAIVTEYGKLHALSFALKDQHSETFDALGRTNDDILQRFMLDKGIQESIQQCTDEVLDILQERNDIILYNKFKGLLVKQPYEMLTELLNEVEPQSVITHGDCWNNNFMFKYKDAERTSPSKFVILDWQMSDVHSPAFDLSHFIYVNCSKKELDKFDEIMETYYTSLSNFLRELGSNPEELFTFLDLKRHWKKYSLFGLLFMTILLRFALCEREEAPAFEDLKEGEDMGRKIVIKITDKDAFYDRAKAIVEHYFDYVF